MSYSVLALLGSLRTGSLNRTLLETSIALAPSGLRITEFTRLGELPFYDPDIDGPEKPEPVQAFFDALRAADALLIVSPEYNYSVPAVLKNAIDWASRGGADAPMKRKPVAIQGGSNGSVGSTRMQYHLRQILVALDDFVLAQPEVAIPRLHERIADGRITDEATRALIAKQLVAFEAWIGRTGQRAENGERRTEPSTRG